MRKWGLEMIRCPACGGSLSLTSSLEEGGHIMSGQLRCETEGLAFPIIAGVPRLRADYKSSSEQQTVEAFGIQWKTFDKTTGPLGSMELFLDNLRGFPAEGFAGKNILEVGCGGGQWLLNMAKLGSDRIVGLDFSESVEPCFEKTKHLENVLIVQASIFDRAIAPDCFDAAISIGVLHHLYDPQEGFRQMCRLVKPGGNAAFWVYGREGNGLYLFLSKPFRWIGPQLGKRLRIAVSCLLAFPFWLYTRTPLCKILGVRKDGSERLPLGKYCVFLSTVHFSDIVMLIFDQLTPELAAYLKKEEIERWFQGTDVELSSILPRNGMSWSVVGTRMTG